MIASGRAGPSAVAGAVGLAPEELLFAEPDAGVELLVLLVEESLALDGALVHGLPVGGLTPGLELLGQAWADRARPLGDGGSRAGRVSSCRAGRETGEASGQEVGGGSTGMPPVVIADGQESQRVGWVYRSFTSSGISLEFA